MGQHLLWDPVEDHIVKETDDAGSTVVACEVQPAEPAVSEKPKHRWYQFSLRMLLVIPLLVGVSIGFWGYHREYCLHQAEIHSQRLVPSEGIVSSPELRKNRIRHQIVAEQYRLAVWMPWQLLWIDEPKDVP